MLNGISKILSGDVLKILSDMGHGDSIIIADANFPNGIEPKRFVRLVGVNATDVLKAIVDLFPLDVAYTKNPASVLDLTDGDKEAGMQTPQTWKEFTEIFQNKYGKDFELGKIERFDFYEKASKAYAVIQTGEERIYGDIILVKGCVV